MVSLLLVLMMEVCPRNEVKVVVAPAQVRVIPAWMIPRLCSTRDVVDGCALFTRVLLNGHCHTDGEVWRLHSSAQLDPIIYLKSIDSRILQHEHRHVDDIAERTSAYLSALAGRQYAYEGDCQTVAAAEKVRFARKIRELQAESQTRLR